MVTRVRVWIEKAVAIYTLLPFSCFINSLCFSFSQSSISWMSSFFRNNRNGSMVVLYNNHSLNFFLCFFSTWKCLHKLENKRFLLFFRLQLIKIMSPLLIKLKSMRTYHILFLSLQLPLNIINLLRKYHAQVIIKVAAIEKSMLNVNTPQREYIPQRGSSRILSR